jgi:uncharacterized protein (TIGR02217 family)
MSFHEIRFPSDISLGSSGGPERRTEIVVLGSGHEERNTRWSQSKRRFNAGYGVKSLSNLNQVIAFFEERRGRLYGFRWKDHADYSSAGAGELITLYDQQLGLGDASNREFQLIKQYGAAHAPYARKINKPVSGTLLVGVDGTLQTEGVDYTIDTTTGMITFEPISTPANESIITAGFEFDVPVRFDTDSLRLNMSRFNAGEIPDIPITEIRV